MARVLRGQSPETKIVVCEPADAPMLTSHAPQARNDDGTPAAGHPAWKPHPMQGWAPDFIPKLTAEVDLERVYKILTIQNGEAMKASQELAAKEGIFVGITSGATFAGARGDRARSAEGREHPRDAAGYGRTLSLHAAVRRCAGGHDGGRAKILRSTPFALPAA